MKNQAHVDSGTSDISLHGELSQIIQDFDKLNTTSKQFISSPEKNLSIIVNEIVASLLKIPNEGNELLKPQNIFNYLMIII